MTSALDAEVGLAEVEAAVARAECFEHLSGKRREKYLRKLIQESHLRVYGHEARILHQGDHGYTMFILVRGKVSVDVQVEGALRNLHTLESTPAHTAWFGEGVVLGRTIRPAHYTAVGPVVALEVEKVRLEKLDNQAVGVIDRIQAASESRAIRDYLAQHRAFSALDPDSATQLVRASKLATADRHDAVFREGEAARSVLIVKSGVVKLERKGRGGTSVLAYFNAGDVVGARDPERRPGTLIAMGFAEYIEVPKALFDAVVARTDARVDMGGAQRWSDQLNKALNTQGRAAGAELSSKTGMIFVDEFMQEGAQIAQSLLTIDLDLCIRCGNCVVACESRHGHAKMTRRGKRLVRRRSAEEHDHQPLLLPSSCRHCESPECMIGCPTGAIHRKVSGEVAIHDFCIGCSNCALRCPWDNITMVSTPDRWVLDRVTGKNLATPKIASKCDLCAGYDEANCVNACPTKAILRVEPSYFPEVRQLIGEAGGAVDGRTDSADRPDRSRWVIAGLALLALAGLVVLYASGGTRSAFSPQRLALGGLALTFMTLATALLVRRRLARFPRRPPHPDKPANPARAGLVQLGPMYLWARAHVWLGGLALVATLLHADFRLGGVVTAMVALLLLLEIATGLFGLAYSKWMPAVIARIERDSQVEEDVVSERQRLVARRAELLADVPEAVKAAAAKTAWAAGTRLSRYRARYDGAAAERELLAALAPHTEPLDRAHHTLIESLAHDAIRLEEIKAVLTLYQLRRAWLSIHITVTAMLFVFVAVHVASVLYFFTRLG